MFPEKQENHSGRDSNDSVEGKTGRDAASTASGRKTNWAPPLLCPCLSTSEEEKKKKKKKTEIT